MGSGCIGLLVGMRDPARHPEGQKVGDRTWGLGFRRLGFRGLGFRVFFKLG